MSDLKTIRLMPLDVAQSWRKLHERHEQLRTEDPEAFRRLTLRKRQGCSTALRSRRRPVSLAPVRILEGC